jgi:hypothetical protein
LATALSAWPAPTPARFDSAHGLAAVYCRANSGSATASAAASSSSAHPTGSSRCSARPTNPRGPRPRSRPGVRQDRPRPGPAPRTDEPRPDAIQTGVGPSRARQKPGRSSRNRTRTGNSARATSNRREENRSRPP